MTSPLMVTPFFGVAASAGNKLEAIATIVARITELTFFITVITLFAKVLFVNHNSNRQTSLILGILGLF